MISSSAIFNHARRCLLAMPVSEWLVLLRLHASPCPQTLAELSICPRHRSAVNSLMRMEYLQREKKGRLTLYALTPKALHFLDLPTAFSRE